MDKMITVITICFNSKNTIKRTFDSVLSQKYLPKEYIVVDGGSEDGTVSIIEKYKEQFERKGVNFIWISEKDKGLYDAMNKGSKMASGRWLHFLNSDDYYINDFVLENVSHYLVKTDAFIVYGRTICIQGYEQYVMPDIKEDKLRLNMLIGCPVQQPSTFYRSNLFKDNNHLFDITYKISADYKLFVELILERKKFLFMPVFVTCFSQEGISSIHKYDLAFQEDIRLLRECNVNTFLMRLKGYTLCYKCVLLTIQFLSKL